MALNGPQSLKRHARPAEHPCLLKKSRCGHHDNRITELIAAGFKKQRNIEHHAAALLSGLGPNKVERHLPHPRMQYGLKFAESHGILEDHRP